MKLKVTQENLSKALNTVARVAASRTTLPILSNILIKAEQNSLSVAATNLEVAVTYTVPGKVNQTGSITVPSRLMTEFVSSLPDGTIDLTLEGQALHITADKYNSTINGVSADEFPSLPEIQDGESGSVTSADLKKALQQTVFAASGDEARQVLTAVYTHSHEGELYIVATDSYRLAEKKIGNTDLSFELLVPASTMQELLRVIGDEDKDVSYTYDDTQAMFKTGDVTIISRLVDGKYPDYRQLIPKKGEIEFTIKRSDFVNITKVSSLFAKESAGSITLEVSEDEQEVSIRSIASQVGENISSAEAIVRGSGSVTLNSRYLLDALNAFDDDEIKFVFNNKTSPCVITSSNPKKQDYLHVVMPLRS